MPRQTAKKEARCKQDKAREDNPKEFTTRKWLRVATAQRRINATHAQPNRKKEARCKQDKKNAAFPTGVY